MFSQDRGQIRSIFFRTWQNYRDGLPLEGIEKIILDIALRHPEYHALLEDPDRYQDSDYLPEVGAANPFLHMGMHIAIEEQLSIDQPVGIRSHYQRILKKTTDEHAAQHLVMECLAEMVWQAQRNHGAPDASIYFSCLEKL